MSVSINRAHIIDSFAFWILLAVFLRLIAMLIAVHGDFVFVNYFPGKLAHEGVLDIYRYIDVNFGEDMKFTWTYYPPLTYFVLGAFQFILRPFTHGFYQWIHAVYSAGTGVSGWLTASGVSFDFFRYLFFMKLPYLAFDGLCIFAIFQYVGDRSLRMKALKLWSVNPVILYGVYMFGQVDIMPASLAVASLLLIKRGKYWWGFLLLSAAALFKTFTVFLILPFLIVLARSRKAVLKNMTAVIIPFILVLLPLYISSRGCVMVSLFPKFYIERSAAIPWPFVQKMIFTGLYLFLTFTCFKLRKEREGVSVLGLSISALMLVYTLFFVPVHYFVWVVPFLVIAVCLRVVPAWLYWFQIFCLFVYNLNSPKTTTALLAPVNPRFFYGLPGVPDLMHSLSIRWGAVMLGAQLVFIAVCVLIAMDLTGRTSFLKRLGVRSR